MSREVAHRTLLLLTLDKLQCLLAAHNVDATGFVPAKHDAVALIRNEDHLGAEGGADELARHAACASFAVILATLLLRDGLEHFSHSGSILCV